MKKILILLISLFITFSIIFFVLKDKFDINRILKNIENNFNMNINLYDNQKWSYYPKITYKNNLSLNSKNGDLIVERSNINITRGYGIISPFIIEYQSPSILYKGINFKDSKIKSEYNNKIININKFSANIIDGNIETNGYLSIDNKKEIILNGSFNNIYVNQILKQLKIADWERIKIELSSTNFSLRSIYDTPEKIIQNLNGEMNVTGSIIFISKEEERFGVAFLSILTDKFVNIKPLSQSLKYLLNKFADVPSNISGKININDGILTTKNLLIQNENEKALLTANLNLKSNNIDGRIDLYENDDIFLTAELTGNIKNPEILIDGKVFTKKENNKPKNIKKIFENGIQSLIDDILNLND